MTCFLDKVSMSEGSPILPIMTPVVALHYKLVGSCDQFETIGMIEPQRQVNEF